MPDRTATYVIEVVFLAERYQDLADVARSKSCLAELWVSGFKQVLKQ